ncbi:hypothetical protein BGZ96_003703 [Linnemannia gamsii]|uniref:F-box domain-containing protein n=1 Tax=Linnemannia gamsii TaxID=64522 RepID=A0ABQ7K7H5_9FUNG|nr:hypothetical protein BGZ96_003703 [Linnemannia gamsii]
MPSTATMRFFELPELVIHLAHHYLDPTSIFGLMRASRQMYTLYGSTLFYSVFADYNPKRKNLLASTESINALVRNAHLVRQLKMNLLDMVYYVNCVFAYQEQSSTFPPPAHTVVAGQQEREQSPLLRRPRWLAPPDPQICAVHPIPLIIHLTSLTLHLRCPIYPVNCPYLLPSYKDPRATLTQTCWLLNLNPHLLDLRLSGMGMKDQRDTRLLTRSILGLERLQNMRFDFIIWEENSEEMWSRMPVVAVTATATRKLASAIFFCCPPSLRTLYVERTEDSFWMDEVTQEYGSLEPEQPQSWEMSSNDEEELNLAVALPRLMKEPKAHLTSLQLWDLGDDLSEAEFREMLATCPNLTNIVIPTICSIKNPQQLAQDIAHRLCPKLTTFEKVKNTGNSASWELTVRILEALSEQQVQKFYCREWSFFIPSLSTDDIGSMFRRQSRTLRDLRLAGCRNINSKVMQVILVECVALELLQVRLWNQMKMTSQQQYWWTLCIELGDAVEFPWGCTRIQDLDLTIVIPDEPLHHLANGEIPYYNRPSPTPLSAAETAQFRSLEAFYRQLGRLTELKRLDLKAIYHDPTRSRLVSGMSRVNSFPGMLNLKNETTGRPGYLHHLGGLSKLKALFGSVSATTEETKVTIGMEEVEWMHRHWPALEKAHFFTVKNEKMFTAPFQWLLKQRAEEKKPLQLATSV